MIHNCCTGTRSLIFFFHEDTYISTFPSCGCTAVCGVHRRLNFSFRPCRSFSHTVLSANGSISARYLVHILDRGDRRPADGCQYSWDRSNGPLPYPWQVDRQGANDLPIHPCIQYRQYSEFPQTRGWLFRDPVAAGLATSFLIECRSRRSPRFRHAIPAWAKLNKCR